MSVTDKSLQFDVLKMGRSVLEKERDGVTKVLDHLDEAFERAVEAILQTTGRVAVTGMGKAGLVGAKIAATLASTGTPAYVLHPVEAIHGDLGMVCVDDVVLALTNSGESEELIKIVPKLKRIGCTVIAITSRRESRCAKASDIVLSLGKQEEACPLGMAPSSSTTAMLALGDALALTVSEIKGFDREQYAVLHPGGALGRSLMHVEEIMRTDANCPIVRQNGTVQDYIRAVMLAPSRAGAAAVVDQDHNLVGFFTDGDLKRLLSKMENPGTANLQEVMTSDPKRVRIGDLVSQALEIMQRHKIDEMPVVDEDNRVVGQIDIQDLLAAGFSLFDAG